MRTSNDQSKRGTPNPWGAALRLCFLNAAIAVFLSACGGSSAIKPGDSLQGPQFSLESLPAYLKGLEDEPLTEKTSGQLLAIDFLIAEQEIDWAQSIIKQFKTLNLNGEQKLRYLLAQGKIAVINGEPYLAHRYFFDKNVNEELLRAHPAIAIEFIDRRATLLLDLSENLRSVGQRVLLGTFIEDDTNLAQLNHDIIWEALADIPTDQLYELSRQEKQLTEQGWYSLAAMSKSSGSNYRQQIKDIRHWQETWPEHPANQLMPADLQLILQLAETPAKNIAVLLPITGKLGGAAEAIKEGILAAYYDEASSTEHVPALQFFDTNGADIASVYEQAKLNGAEFIIGPLAKANVEVLLNLPQREIPVLALNLLGENSSEQAETLNTESIEGSEETEPEIEKEELELADDLSELAETENSETQAQPLYQFGLVIEQEARQVAERAWRDGHRRAVIISPSSNWGDRGAQAFSQYWLELGGTIISQHRFTNRKSYSPLIESSVATDQSKRRHQTLQRLLGTKLDFEPRRRKDIDFIFMLANNLTGRQLKPLLAFHYAGDIPVYATSHIFSSTSDLSLADLNGIRFTSMPWAFNEGLSERKAIQAYSENAGSLQAFYAMGVDAYHIYPRLEQLTILHQAQFYGTTGKLSVVENNIIFRQQSWAEISDNKALEITSQIQGKQLGKSNE